MSSKPTMLIAEDNDGNFFLLRVLLEHSFTIIRAITGQEAIDFHKKQPYNIILMDIGLPEKNGMEACKEIRLFDPNVPIIAQTAYALEYEKEATMKFGFNYYLTKPIKKLELYTEIASHGFDISESRHLRR